MSNTPRPVAIVTGSSKGIGAAIATGLAEAGYDVFVTFFTDEAGARGVADGIRAANGTAYVANLDVTEPDSVARLFEEVADRYGRLDLLVNNAAQELSKPLADQTLEDWRRVVSVKLDGAFMCTQAALPLFVESGCASMIAISSYEGEQPSPTYPAYGAATAGLNAFVKAMALYLPAFGARCNAVCPGAVRTPLWAGGRSGAVADWAHNASANPVARNPTPRDVAEAVILLATDQTRMLNGNFLYVNGGNHLRGPQ